jgi:hypothetical protein
MELSMSSTFEFVSWRDLALFFSPDGSIPANSGASNFTKVSGGLTEISPPAWFILAWSQNHVGRQSADQIRSLLSSAERQLHSAIGKTGNLVVQPVPSSSLSELALTTRYLQKKAIS